MRPTLCLFVLCLTALAPRMQAAPGDLDPTFDAGSGINGPVHAIVLQPDGKMIIGGDFTLVRGLTRTNLARLHADGSGDPSFTAPPNDFIRCLALQADGKVVVGSAFINYGLTRLNADGSADAAFNANALEAIAATEPYEPAFVNALIVQPDGKIIYPGETPLRLHPDGTRDATFIMPPSGPIFAMARQSDGKFIISAYDATSTYYIRRHRADGSIDPTFNGAAISGVVEAIAPQADGKILLGGAFLMVNGTATAVARLNSDGSPDPTFPIVPGTSPESGIFATVKAIAPISGGRIVIGGRFNSIHGTSRQNLACLKADGTLDTAFFTETAGVGGFAPATAVTVHSLAEDADGRMLAGGVFAIAQGAGRRNLARFEPDGVLDPSFDPGRRLHLVPLALAMASDGKWFAAGYRRRPFGDGTPAPIARLLPSGEVDPTFARSGQPMGDASALALQSDGKILIGSTDNPGPLVLRFHGDGSRDFSFNLQLGPLLPYDEIPPGYGGEYSAVVTAIRVQPDDRIVVAGYAMTFIAGEELFEVGVRYFLFRFHSDGSHDNTFAGRVGDRITGLGWYFGWLVYPPSPLLIQPDGKIIAGGAFTSLNGTSRHGLARVHANGVLDTGFVPEVPQFSFTASVTLQPDGKTVAGGSFGILRLNEEGRRDASFQTGSGPSAAVNAVARQPDGKILIAGAFTAYNGTPRDRIARLHADGSLDATFDPGTGVDGPIAALALHPDGRVFIAGNFLAVNGVLRPYVARLEGDAPAPVPFASWIAGFGLQGIHAAADADPDLDDQANGVEYILGGDPTQPAPQSLRPEISLTTEHVLFTFLRADFSESGDIVATVEAGTDLITWPMQFTIGAATASSSAGVTVIENGTEPDTIVVAIPSTDQPQLFARIRVTKAP